ncbi:hypothetical protein [Sphingosinicella rhizophila]|uniref:Uncharacterized protein n=1 Tax=Sphingosinicella rhizophila TaxID=3050082 RepID=A0ABU3Q6D4_9SPHN|nr:hypothetical protein [Sphingosinicella sp. GR2756]MDT9598528.1 hypothetical protein [Sphingosinicella sp. GR2756]
MVDVVRNGALGADHAVVAATEVGGGLSFATFCVPLGTKSVDCGSEITIAASVSVIAAGSFT